MLKWYVKSHVWLAEMVDRLSREEKGAVAIEYVGLAAVVVVIIGAFVAKGEDIGNALAGAVQAAISAVSVGG